MREMEKLVRLLIEKNKTISSMESCTGGGFANMVTNVPGSSEVLKFSAVTYSNDFKIKMGVDESLIDKYSVYSIEVAKDMSKKISEFTFSDYGVGITGKINRSDKNNLHGADNLVYASIYDRLNDRYYTISIEMVDDSRMVNKTLIISNVVKVLNTII
jgi:PncC family amidohydrolase